MNFIKLLKRLKEKDPAAYNNIYESLIENKIRARYSINAELAIQRQRDVKPEEFAEFNAYVKKCKTEFK